MPRAMWSGSISFGLVNIPVKLYTAVSRKSVSFNQLDRTSGARIRYRKVSAETGDEVANDDIVKGYELPSGEYVTVTDDELAQLDPKASRTIEIEEFVDLVDIDPVFYDSAYLLAPDKATTKPYALLATAMEQSGKVGIARVVMRTKQYLCAVRPVDGHLVMSTMVYADEINEPASIPELADLEGVEVSDKELTMANQLIEGMSDTFDPAKYTDTHRTQVMELIERKAAGETDIIATPEPQEDKVVDLMAALEASVAAAKQARGRHPTSAKAPTVSSDEIEGTAGSDDGDADVDAAKERVTDHLVELDGHRLRLRNLEKVLYPEVGFTKAEVIDYYVRIAPVLLPHVTGRGVTFKRYPDGVDGQSFFEKRCAGHRPDFVSTVLGPGDRQGGIEYCCLDSVPAMAWAANMATLEIHAPMALGADIESPQLCVFDLDPGAPAGIVECARVALAIRDVLSGIGLTSVVKTSGSKGMQLYVPLNSPHTHDHTSEFAHAVALVLEKHRPAEVVSTMTKALRVGKVFIDWSQNSRHKTTIAPYSLRARARPTVSTPITWDEVSDAADGGSDPLRFVAADVLDRVADLGDLFAAAATMRQELPPV